MKVPFPPDGNTLQNEQRNVDILWNEIHASDLTFHIEYA